MTHFHVNIYDNYYFSSNLNFEIIKYHNLFMHQNKEEIDSNRRLKYFESFIDKNTAEIFSPVGEWLNGILRHIDTSSIRVEVMIRKNMTNPLGILHGGVSATILDEVCGMLVLALGRDFAYTSVNLNCDFLHFAKLEEIVFAHAQIIRAGKNIIHVEGQIMDGSGKIITKCSSNLIQTNVRIPHDFA